MEGQKIFGENRLQEALQKIEDLKEYSDINFHFIGHIQSNKVKYFDNHFSLIQSIDRVEIAEKINDNCKQKNIVQHILIQINLAKEPQKSGVYVEHLDELIKRIYSLKNLVLCGFMFIPPYKENPEDNRPLFREMKGLFDNYKSKLNDESFVYLSMGMSADFEVAISEGSNMVRIGSAIFGCRNY